MSSTTRASFSPLSTSSSVSPLKRKAMSVTQTYYLAHTARGKLSSEASRSDHNLRLLVGHANLLDSLMLELAQAEQEQESWFNQSVRKASEPKHIQWADAVVEDPEEDWQAEDADDSSDSSSEYDSDEEMETGFASLQRVSSRSTIVAQVEVAEVEEEFEEDDEEDMEGLQLQRTHSHSLQPPALDHDSDDSSEDESMPPSPPNNALPTFSEKSQFYSKSATASSSIPPSEQAAFFEEGFYLPQRTQPTLISAISVY